MQNKKILIIDDEKDILEFLSYNFKKEGYEVFTTIDSKDALNKAILFNPDLIIADIRMPEMNGIEMCREMKRNEQLKNIPVLFLTADSDEYLALSAHHAGGTYYLNKPIRLNLLLSAINEMLDKNLTIT